MVQVNKFAYAFNFASLSHARVQVNTAEGRQFRPTFEFDTANDPTPKLRVNLSQTDFSI